MKVSADVIRRALIGVWFIAFVLALFGLPPSIDTDRLAAERPARLVMDFIALLAGTVIIWPLIMRPLKWRRASGSDYKFSETLRMNVFVMCPLIVVYTTLGLGCGLLAITLWAAVVFPLGALLRKRMAA